MKVLLINGSPDQRGCTYTALREVEKELNAQNIETEIIQIGRRSVSGCICCRKCHITGKCVIDDIVNTVAEKLHAADGLVVGTPVYYGSANGSVISLLDRLFTVGGYSFAYKAAAAVVSLRRTGAIGTFNTLNDYFARSYMPIVPSQTWNVVYGQTPEEILQDAEGIQTLKILADNMAWMLRCFENGRRYGINPPKVEAHINHSVSMKNHD